MHGPMGFGPGFGRGFGIFGFIARGRKSGNSASEVASEYDVPTRHVKIIRPDGTWEERVEYGSEEKEESLIDKIRRKLHLNHH